MTDPPAERPQIRVDPGVDGHDKTSDEEERWNIQGESSPGKKENRAEKERKAELGVVHKSPERSTLQLLSR